MTAPVDVKVVLDWLRGFGIELTDLPKGDRKEPGDGGHCPVENALAPAFESVMVDYDIVITDMGDYNVPYDVSQWIQGFDKGMYPQYVHPSSLPPAGANE